MLYSPPLIFGVALMYVLAAAEEATKASDPLTYLFQIGGPIGVFLVLVATGKFFVTRRELDAANKRADDAVARADIEQAKREALNEKMTDRIIPLLTDSTRVLTEVGRALQISPAPATASSSTQQQLMDMMRTLELQIKELGQ